MNSSKNSNRPMDPLLPLLQEPREGLISSDSTSTTKAMAYYLRPSKRIASSESPPIRHHTSTSGMSTRKPTRLTLSVLTLKLNRNTLITMQNTLELGTALGLSSSQKKHSKVWTLWSVVTCPSPQGYRVPQLSVCAQHLRPYMQMEAPRSIRFREGYSISSKQSSKVKDKQELHLVAWTNLFR